MSLNTQVKIILVETTSPGNIGSALRAMKTMNFSKLCLVNPKHFPSDEVTALAANAADLIEKVEVVKTIDEALEDQQLVIATSSRERKVPWPNEALNIASPKIIEAVTKKNKVAIMFGREDRGLTNDELQRCNLHVHIPANKDYPVLNLAMSVQVVCYQLFMDMHLETIKQNSGTWDVPTASSNHVNRLIEHFIDIAEQVEVFNKGNPRQIGARIKRLFTRIGLDEMEVNFMRGFLSAIDKNLNKK